MAALVFAGPGRTVPLGSESLIADPSLAAAGADRVGWTRANMPLLQGLREEFAADRPLAGRRLGMCLHV